MNTKAATTQIHIQQWIGIIQDRASSGLTVDDYCESHGLTRNQYYYWLRKVRAGFLEAAPQLVELHVPETVPAVSETMPINSTVTADVPQLLISKGDIEIRVNSNISPELLMTVFHCLSHAQ
jgi:transposase-like protein